MLAPNGVRYRGIPLYMAHYAYPVEVSATNIKMKSSNQPSFLKVDQGIKMTSEQRNQQY